MALIYDVIIERIDFAFILFSWEKITGLANLFPNAKIVASTFDNFTQHILPLANDADSVPVMTQEMGDTWVYGVPSDPQKVSAINK